MTDGKQYMGRFKNNKEMKCEEPGDDKRRYQISGIYEDFA